ncbi:Patatin-like phospholipase domain-containing protein 2 [Dinochytrium kinnereticum]|nr:Patatin-like phospholipase domain-containing protein 2 [Dinochytrium kinnereticum]
MLVDPVADHVPSTAADAADAATPPAAAVATAKSKSNSSLLTVDLAQYLISKVPPAAMAWNTFKAISIATISPTRTATDALPSTAVPADETAPSSPTGTLVDPSATPPAPLTPNGTHFEIPPPYTALDSTPAPTGTSSSSTTVDPHSPRLTTASADVSSFDDASEAGDQPLSSSTALSGEGEGDGVMAYDPALGAMETEGFTWNGFFSFSNSPSSKVASVGVQASPARTEASASSSGPPKRTLVARILFGKGDDSDDESDFEEEEEKAEVALKEGVAEAQQETADARGQGDGQSEGIVVASVSSSPAKKERGLVSRILFGKGEDSDDEDEVDVEAEATAALAQSEEAEPQLPPVSLDDLPTPGVEAVTAKVEKPERGFWTKVFYGKGEDEEEAVDDEAEEEVTEAPAVDAEATAETVAEELMEQTPCPPASTEDVADPRPVSEATPATVSGVGLSSLRKVGKVVAKLPGVSMVTMIPGATTVAQLPLISSVIDALFVDHEATTSRALANAAITPMHVLAAPSSCRNTPPPLRRITAMTNVAAPKGSVVYMREKAAESPAPAPPPDRTKGGLVNGVESLARWGIVKGLGIASSSLDAVNTVGDLAAAVSERIAPSSAANAPASPENSTSSPTPSSTPALYRARDAALSATSTLLGYVASNSMVSSAASQLFPSSAATALSHSLSIPMPKKHAAKDADEEADAPFLARVDTFRHFCAFPPGQIRNPLSFSFAGGCGVEVALPASSTPVPAPAPTTTPTTRRSSILPSFLASPTAVASSVLSTIQAASSGPMPHQREGRYALGCARVVREKLREDVVDASRFLGSGFGAIVAAALALGVGFEGVERILGEVEGRGSTRFLGPVATMSNILRRGLEAFIPEDVSRANDRLFVSVTKFPSFENVIVSEFTSKEFVHETPVFLNGTMILSGNLTNPIPIYDALTVSISSFPREANVGPCDPETSAERFGRGFAVVPDRGGRGVGRFEEEWGEEGRRDMEEWFRMISGSGVITMLAFKLLRG